ALGGGEDGPPLRLVFDEGHHLFDAADSAFSADLTGAEMAELRRWLLGAEGGRSRARGLRRRLEGLIGDRPEVKAPRGARLMAARALPLPGWPSRLPGGGSARPDETPNAGEVFMRAAREQVLARTQAAQNAGLYDSECDLFPVTADLPGAAEG